ncbi:TetR/AcrR family transcriptional regulator [Agromyces sp. NPDC055520]
MSNPRGNADERRAQAVAAGLSAFADLGMTTAAIRQVADRMGVSEPYVFRLFGSKQTFFLACIDGLPALITEMFVRAAADADEPMEAMGASFRELVSDGVISGFWLQACAAARTDEVIAARCRDVIASTLRATRDGTGADTQALATFMGRGALVMMLQTLGVDLSGGSQAAIASLVEKG